MLKRFLHWFATSSLSPQCVKLQLSEKKSWSLQSRLPKLRDWQPANLPCSIVFISLGLCLLAFGAIFYIVYRPDNSAYFVEYLNIPQIISGNSPFGRWRDNIPTFAHTTSFCLISIGVINQTKLNKVIILSWIVLNGSLEMLQNYKWLHSYVPTWFEEIFFLENTKSYFINGTFDWLDIVSILCGGLIAYILVLVIECYACKS